MINRTKELRKKKKLTQAQVAEAIGTTTRIFGSWENDETPLPLIQACKIAELFECTLYELAGIKPPEYAYADSRQRQINQCYPLLSDPQKDSALAMMTGLVADADTRRDGGATYPEQHNPLPKAV